MSRKGLAWEQITIPESVKESKSGTDLGRQRKGGERVIETLGRVVCEGDNCMYVLFSGIGRMWHGEM
jgi:hypothetical protein